MDSTGAGDFFAGGFAHGWLRGWAVAECVRAGHALGGAVVQRVGTSLEPAVWHRLHAECAAERGGALRGEEVDTETRDMYQA